MNIQCTTSEIDGSERRQPDQSRTSRSGGVRWFKKAIVQIGVVRVLEGRITDLYFRRWKRNHPDGTFAGFYADRIAKKIARGRHHKTLGRRAWEPGHGRPVELDRTAFAKRGEQNWRQVLAYGVTPAMRCVDYGCGSLRLGQHAIRYLDKGNYWGLDITDVFIAEGLNLIDPQLVDERRPRFGTIDDEQLARIRSWSPDFVFANAVLVHVPPAELVEFLSHIESIMTPGSRAVILYIEDERTERVKSMNWVYPESALREAASAAGLRSTITFEDVHEGPSLVDGRKRRAMLLHAQG